MTSPYAQPVKGLSRVKKNSSQAGETTASTSLAERVMLDPARLRW